MSLFDVFVCSECNFSVKNQKNMSCMVSNNIFTVQNLSDVIYIWSSELLGKRVVYLLLGVTISLIF